MINEWALQKYLCEVAFMNWMGLECEEQEMKIDNQVLSVNN